jgi:hypothetical protein
MYSSSKLRDGSVNLATAEPDYHIEFKNEEYQIRNYRAILIAETLVQGQFDSVGKKAFRILADYIFGYNASNTKIAMSVPVLTQPCPESGFIVQFAMLGDLNIRNIPQPLDPRVQIRELSPCRMAALVYSGSWSEANFVEKRNQLLFYLKRDLVEVIGLPRIAKYNSPFQPSFLRRNEVLIEVQK